MAKIRDLARLYNLTPREVRTLLRVVDQASKPTGNAQRDVDRLGRSEANPILSVMDGGLRAGIKVAHTALGGVDRHNVSQNINVESDAQMAARGAQIAMNAVNDVYRTIFVTTRKRNADGAIHEYADGGVRAQIGSQSPQIRPCAGPAGLTLGSGPCEAFVSGHPAKVDRSRVIAPEVAQRLGGEARFADGGMRDYARPVGGVDGASTVIVQAAPQGPVRVDLDLGSGIKLKGTMTQIAQREAREEILIEKNHQAMMRRAR